MPDTNQLAPSLKGWLFDLAGVVLWFAKQPNGLLIEGIAALLILVFVIVMLNRLDQEVEDRTGPKATADLRVVPRTSHKPRGPLFIPLELGPVTIDLQPKRNETIHTAIGGTSRLGKSTTVLPLLDLPIGVLTIAMDNTRPIMERIRELPDGIEWTNEPDWPIGIDLLRGSPRIASEVLVEGWTAKTLQDTGKWRRYARGRLWTGLERLDNEGIERNIPDLVAMMWKKTGDSEVDRACRDWATRLESLSRSMGNSLGHDLDLTQAMRSRKKVLLRVNPFIDPMDSPMLSGMLLVHARRAVQEVGEPFVLIVEEAGQMSNYQAEIVPLAQAAADRGVPLVVLTQNMSLLPVEVINNISAWVSYGQEDRREMMFAAHKLRLDPEHLQRESFPGRGEQQGRGWCYVRAPGLTTRLVHVKLPKKKGASKSVLAPILRATRPASRWAIVDPPRRLDGWQPEPLSLPPPAAPPKKDDIPWWVGTDDDMLRFWGQMKRTGRATPLWSPDRGIWWAEQGCLEWHGPLSKAKENEKLGRPRSNIGRKSVTVYVETARAAGKEFEPSWDHDCDQPVCVDPDHGHATSIAINNQNRRQREIMLEKAWMDRYGQIPQWWKNRHYERAA